MCNCNQSAQRTRTVWRVMWPDGNRSADYVSERDARLENSRKGGSGVVMSAQVPK